MKTHLLQPFLEDTLIHQLSDMHQKRIREDDSRQEAVKLRCGCYHTERVVELWDVGYSHNAAANQSGRDDDGERSSGLDEGDLASSKEMDDEELVQSDRKMQ